MRDASLVVILRAIVMRFLPAYLLGAASTLWALGAYNQQLSNLAIYGKAAWKILFPG